VADITWVAANAWLGPTANCCSLGRLNLPGLGDVDGLRAVQTLGHLELDRVDLLAATETIAVVLGVVHEKFRAISADDEAVDLFRVELHDSSHGISLPKGLDSGPRLGQRADQVPVGKLRKI
jgi:hypothetical protein